MPVLNITEDAYPAYIFPRREKGQAFSWSVDGNKRVLGRSAASPGIPAPVTGIQVCSTLSPGLVQIPGWATVQQVYTEAATGHRSSMHAWCQIKHAERTC